MCGLLSVINKHQNGFPREQQEVFSSLLFLDYLRGQDSTGTFLVTNTGDVSLAKEASDPLRFMRTDDYDKLMKKAWSRGGAMVGHNRKATRGTVNDDNAHPFVVDDSIVLVHNGTMFGDHKKIADVEVDSHAIAHAIHEHKNDVAAALSSFDAAYALIWYDVAAGTLNFIRNRDRPLWWMETSNAWIWSSEEAMLAFVANHHNLIVKTGPRELPEDTLQIYTLERNNWAVDAKELKITKPVYKSTVTYGSEYSYGQHRTRHPYACGYENDPVWGGVEEEEIVVPFQRQEDADTPAERIMDRYPGHMQTYQYADRAGTAAYFERVMAIRLNKIISQEEFTSDIVAKYPYGTDVIAKSFDYHYVNQVDDKDGFYLYCADCANPDIVIRFSFLKKNMSEERIVQIASGEYVYQLTVDRKRWAPMQPGATTARTAGYVVMEASNATLLYGGGIGDASVLPEEAKIH